MNGIINVQCFFPNCLKLFTIKLCKVKIIARVRVLNEKIRAIFKIQNLFNYCLKNHNSLFHPYLNGVCLSRERFYLNHFLKNLFHHKILFIHF